MRHLVVISMLSLATLGTGCPQSDGGDADGAGTDGGSDHARDAGADRDHDPEMTRDAGGDDDDGQTSILPQRDAGSAGAEDAGSSNDVDAGGGDAGAQPNSVVPDPAPEAATPGEYTCDGCPDADVGEFEIAAGSETAQSFTGVVTGAVGNGEFYLESEDGQSIGGTIPTDAGGNYSFTAPLFCGTQLLKCLWSNDAGTYVAVVQIVTADCIAADIRATLTWDNLGADFELHLIKQGGHINDNATDCTWTSCMGTGPDWGVVGDDSDNPRKDVDNTGNFGPENIFYAQPEDGTYTVMVEHWGAGSPDADGAVTINVLDSAPVVVPISNLASHHVFTAATIEWPSRTVTPVGSDYDCTANWSGGCRDLIP